MASRSGVPIVQALSVVAQTIENDFIAAKIEKVREGVERGESILHTTTAAGVFTPVVLQMIAVGEETGAMECMLSKIADFYDGEVDAAVDALTAMLEPLMMVGLGGTVGGMLIAMYLPIYKIADTIG